MSDSFDLPDNLSDRAEELLKHIPLQSWNAYAIPAIESLSKNENIGIACSGGADSTLCVLLMYAAFPDLKSRMIVSHFNHRLRGDFSDQDEAFVQELSNKLDLRCETDRAIQGSHKFDENSLRELRLKFWNKLGENKKISLLVQGHHLNDFAETLLWRIPRGVSVDGLVSPKPVSKIGALTILRPFISLTKEFIKHALNSHGIPWRDDNSNKEDFYLRNKMRNKVLPVWSASCDRDLLVGINKTRELLEEDSQALDFHATEVYNKCSLGETINLDIYLQFPKATQRRVLIRWVSKMVSDADQFRFLMTKMGDISKIISNGESKSQKLSSDWKISRSKSLLFLEYLSNSKSIPKAILPVGSSIYFSSGHNVTSQLIHLDVELYKNILRGKPDQDREAFLSAKTTGDYLYVKSRDDGDRFLPMGAPGSKKVSDWMIDRKWSQKQKVETPTVVTTENEIIWIPGFAPAEIAKVNKQDRLVIRLTYNACST